MLINETIKNLISFTKIEHTAFSLPLIFVGAWFGMDKSFPTLTNFILIIIASVGARTFGMSINRIFDKNFDILNPRTYNRELPSGKISVESALFIACLGLLLYMLSCLMLGTICWILSPIPLFFLFSYPILKRFTFLCHFGVGFCLALAPLCSFVAISKSLQFNVSIVIFSFFVFCWLSGADIIYAIMDIKSDRSYGIYSLPAVFGSVVAQIIAGIVHFLAIVSIGVILLLSNSDILAWVFFVITIIFIFSMYIPAIPINVRFFPLSSIAGFFGAVTIIFS